MRLLKVEIRRALHRRVVWVLIALALTGCAAAGVIAFISSSGMAAADLAEESHPAVMASWADLSEDSALLMAALFLMMGGLFGGASVTGAEWRAGTVATLLTWEPRRARAHLSRIGACALLAAAISTLLQIVWLAAFTPTAIARGITDGVDAAWWFDVATGVGRVSLLTAAAATLGASVATIGRNTAFGAMVVFGWLTVGEGILRGLRPSIANHLLAENIGTVVSWSALDGNGPARSPGVALVALLAYLAIVTGAGLVGFVRRDVTGAS